MPNCCSIKGCDVKSKGNNSNITLHRLPRLDKKRNTWLEIIGVENLNMSIKHIFVCSLHFEDSCFNRTMNRIKLRDEALPSRTLIPSATQIIFSDRNTSPGGLGLDDGSFSHIGAHDMVNNVPVPQNIIETSSDADISTRELQIIKKLKDKCQTQTKEIKRLKEKIRRQNKKIDLLIEDLTSQWSRPYTEHEQTRATLRVWFEKTNDYFMTLCST